MIHRYIKFRHSRGSGNPFSSLRGAIGDEAIQKAGSPRLLTPPRDDEGKIPGQARHGRILTRHFRAGGNPWQRFTKDSCFRRNDEKIPDFRLQTSASGFTLVEMAIVLVILGLLIGGVLAGRTLIRAAELRAIPTEYSKYITAVTAFKDRYMALPGDMNNATQYWNSAAPNCPGTTTQGTPNAPTCDGNGNGLIDVSASSHEHYRVWQHLANAGLIEGVYDGATGSGHPHWHAVIGKNVPSSRFGGGGWGLRWLGAQSAWPSGGYFDGFYGHNLQFGGESSGNFLHGRLLTPEELWGLDTKMDDGKPARGTLVALPWDNCTDANNSAALDANYQVAVSTKSCGIVFRSLF